jgi:hypothetical protein
MEYLLDINNLDESTLHNIKLHSPVPIQGGSYLAKMTLNNNPLLFQMPTCSTKRGVVTSGKRYYCDLLFNYDHSNVIEFVENLETIVRDKVFEKNELWFQDPPSMEDIEYNWNDSIKQTKQNFYLRTYVGTVKNVQKTVSVYNSNQEQVNIDSILPSSNIITIVEITGLKFSSSSFHINYCLRQIMVLEEKKTMFNKCLISVTKPTHVSSTEITDSSVEEPTTNIDLEKVKDLTSIPIIPPSQQPETPEILNEHIISSDKSSVDLTTTETETVEKQPDNEKDTDDLEILEQNTNKPTLFDTIDSHEQYPNTDSETEDMVSQSASNLEEMTNKVEDTTNIPNSTYLNMNSLEIKEVDLQIPEEEDMVQLKKPDTVYLDMYRQALAKAKATKIKAIQAYLELKTIKNKYMIQEVDEDDDNFGELNFEL